MNLYLQRFSVLFPLVLLLVAVPVSMATAASTEPADKLSSRELAAAERDFNTFCGVCHGRDAKGRGPVADELKTSPPDLTRIATEPGRSRAQLLSTSTRLAAGAIAVGLVISALCASQDERLILLAADASYLPAAPLTVLLLIGAALMLGANVYRAAGYALDRALSLLLIGAVAQGIFLLAPIITITHQRARNGQHWIVRICE